jgi:hypothetical protein
MRAPWGLTPCVLWPRGVPPGLISSTSRILAFKVHRFGLAELGHPKASAIATQTTPRGFIVHCFWPPLGPASRWNNPRTFAPAYSKPGLPPQPTLGFTNLAFPQHCCSLGPSYRKQLHRDSNPGHFFRTCGLSSCNPLVEANNFGPGAVLLSCLVSELQNPHSPGLEPRTVFGVFTFLKSLSGFKVWPCQVWSNWCIHSRATSECTYTHTLFSRNVFWFVFMLEGHTSRLSTVNSPATRVCQTRIRLYAWK